MIEALGVDHSVRGYDDGLNTVREAVTGLSPCERDGLSTVIEAGLTRREMVYRVEHHERGIVGSLTV